MKMDFLFKDIVGFEWDKGNKDKNYVKHGVTNEECEEVFFDDHKRIFGDIIHSLREKRNIMVGKTKANRLLFIVFVARGNYIRVISARDVNRKERGIYEKAV